jgi:hypothetical protein
MTIHCQNPNESESSPCQSFLPEAASIPHPIDDVQARVCRKTSVESRLQNEQNRTLEDRIDQALIFKY